MTFGTNGPWFTCLPGCKTEVPCGPGWHIVGWEAGSLRLPSHPDAEGELVLAALGGDRARCVELAEAWARHADDLSMLAIGPRHPADEIAVGWDEVSAAAQTGPGFMDPRPITSGPGLAGQPRPGPLASQPRATLARVAARQRQMQEDALAAQRRRNDILSLLALGYGFQVRLIGQVAATHAARLADPPGSAGHGGTTPLGPPEGAGHGGTAPLGPPEGGERVRPALVAAIAGRLAPVAEAWLAIDPDQVEVSLHRAPGWGSAELTGHGEDRRLRTACRPAGWPRSGPAAWPGSDGTWSSRWSSRAGRRPGCSGCVLRALNPSPSTCTPARVVPGMSHTGRYERESRG